MRAAVTGQVDLQDYVGNDRADALAANGAAKNAVSRTTEARVKYNVGRATRVLKRLLESSRLSLEWEELHGEARLCQEPRGGKRGSQLQRLLRATEHTLPGAAAEARSLKDLPKGLCCAVCCSSPAKGGTLSWLKSACTPAEQAACAALPGLKRCGVGENSQPTRVGRGDLHPSHRLLHFGGYWWCSVCGSYTTSGGQRASPKGLRRPCAGHPTRAGRDCLRRLERGRPPKQGQNWQQLLAEAGAGAGLLQHSAEPGCTGAPEGDEEGVEDADCAFLGLDEAAG